MHDQNQDIRKEKEILERTQALVEEERKLLAEERGLINAVRNDLRLAALVFVAVAMAAVAGFFTWRSFSARLYFDKAQVTAPRIELSAQAAGELKEVYVRDGDAVAADQPVARVGDELVKAKAAGEIVAADLGIGTQVNKGAPVVSMIDPNDLRVVVHVDEDKGLKDIRVGQLVTFTVDAFGSARFAGTVDEISPTSRQGGIVFNISDKRETQQFDVKIRFDQGTHPEIKNGMSAKVWIYKD